MKKLLFAGMLITILAVAVVGYAFAQTPDPAAPTTPYDGGYGRMGGGMMSRGTQAQTGAYGPLHTYRSDAMAQAFGLTPEELQTRHDAGETMWDIAQEQGLTEEQFTAAMLQARTSAFEQAVADGAITQEQADWMLSRMNQMHANGFGPGTGGCTGEGPAGRSGMMGGGFGRGGGMRWNTQPSGPVN